MQANTGHPVWQSDSKVSRLAIISALHMEGKIARPAVSAGQGQVVICGPGPERAGQAARAALSNGAGALVSFGLAGGLATAADTSAVVIPATLASSAGEWQSDAAWRERLGEVLQPAFSVLDGVLYSSDHVVTSCAAKAALSEQSGAIAVDMESATIAQVAADAAVPFVAIRVIADGPNDALPSDIEGLVTDDGHTRYAGLPRLLFVPGELRLLFSLATRSGRARRTLKSIASALTEADRR